MLQLQTIDPNTLQLLKELIVIPEITHFNLAGGTSLALYLGHRISIDLDFFTIEEFDSNRLKELLKLKYEVSSIVPSKNSLTLYIHYKNERIKVDFIRHNYHIINSICLDEGLRLYSIEDVSAMKLNAILNRGAKKDFYDVYELLKQFSIHDLLGFFRTKYPNTNVLMLIKSLNYFADADVEPNPISLNNVVWENVKDELYSQVRNNF